MVALDAFRDLAVQKSNCDQVCDEIHDSKLFISLGCCVALGTAP